MGCFTSGSTFATLIKSCFIGYINLTIGVLAALALVIFFWGLVRFIYYAESEHERERGRELIVWGLVTLFILFSVWGILQLLEISFFGGPVATPASYAPSYYNTGTASTNSTIPLGP